MRYFWFYDFVGTSNILHMQVYFWSLYSSFDENNRFIDPTGAIKENTLVRVDPVTGHAIDSFGAGRLVPSQI